jgi:phasin family protein
MAAYKSNEMPNPFEMFGGFGKNIFENMMKVGQESVAQSYEKAISASKDQIGKATGEAVKSYDEVFALGTANADAVVKAGTILANGFADMHKQMLAQAQAELETSVETAKALFACRNIQDVMAFQAKLAQANFDKLMAQSSKVAEMTVKVANEAAAPISKRVNVAVDKFMKPLAA